MRYLKRSAIKATTTPTIEDKKTQFHQLKNDLQRIILALEEEIGVSRHPRHITTNKIAKKVNMTYKEVRNRLNKLKEMNVIDKYSVTYKKSGKWQRAIYIRINI